MSNFIFTELRTAGAFCIDAKHFGDSRGWFAETYKEPEYHEAGIDTHFVQDNESFSTKNVMRGLHFQINHPQAKLVRCTRGAVYDVGVDLRKESPTFGEWVGELLSEDNHRQLFIPRGFAHGFAVLTDTAIFSYKCDDVYHPNDEGGILLFDKDLAIKWPALDGEPILSEKDKVAQTFAEYCAARA
ncbi:MAG: dTDP-4-dehydrorhamnose 3,5-epimerase [Coriobacteriales bacterium]|nr:dTDP-4-dehydrorhamnose 3,5-epimerase [Coriobacteriales bacterium]